MYQVSVELLVKKVLNSLRNGLWGIPHGPEQHLKHRDGALYGGVNLKEKNNQGVLQDINMDFIHITMNILDMNLIKIMKGKFITRCDVIKVLVQITILILSQ